MQQRLSTSPEIVPAYASDFDSDEEEKESESSSRTSPLLGGDESDRVTATNISIQNPSDSRSINSNNSN
jgi:hypothetical protein